MIRIIRDEMQVGRRTWYFESVEDFARTIITNTAHPQYADGQSIADIDAAKRFASEHSIGSTLVSIETVDVGHFTAKEANQIESAIRKIGQIFKVVTFGLPNRQMKPDESATIAGCEVFTHSEAAKSFADSLVGTGSCTAARVVTCWSIAGLLDADISGSKGDGWVLGVDLSRAK